MTLEKPFLILQTPRFEINNFIDSHIEPYNSSVQYKVATNTGTDNTALNFHFIWQNSTSTAAVINVSSSVIFNGVCSIGAASGFFSGDTAEATMVAAQYVLRWTGWGNDPDTGDGTYAFGSGNTQPYNRVMHLYAHGGGIFGDAGYAFRTFFDHSVPFNTNSIVVPGHAVIVIQMGEGFYYGFDDGGDISDFVDIDFAGESRMIRCPGVQIEVLSPLTRGATTEHAPPLAATLTH